MEDGGDNLGDAGSDMVVSSVENNSSIQCSETVGKE
jgi:hypothetical protein